MKELRALCSCMPLDRTDHSHWMTSVNEHFIHGVCCMILLCSNLIFVFILGDQISICICLLSAWIDFDETQHVTCHLFG
jgi:hypothetical protein